MKAKDIEKIGLAAIACTNIMEEEEMIKEQNPLWRALEGRINEAFFSNLKYYTLARRM